VGEEKTHFFDATRTATALFGNSVGANMFMLGFGYQHGGLPVSSEAVEKAIELNGEAVKMNLQAFRWGRRAAHDPETVRAMALKAQGGEKPALAQTLDEIVARRVEFLTAYQNAAYGKRFADRIARLRAAENAAVAGSTAVAEAAARALFKLMAIKDEYEVARLYTDGSFRKQLAAQFQDFDRLEFHMAPPILGRTGPDGLPRKSSFGPWMMKGFGVLASLKGLRGTPLDVFGYTAERRMEKRLLADFEADLDLIEARLSVGTIEAAVALASVPMLIRGYGHVKAANAEKAGAERARLVERLNAPSSRPALQAAE
jgi:indolepyruvate ferredoxin oxidoreductase